MINTGTRESQMQWQSVWQREEERHRVQYPREKKYAVPCSANVIFLNLSAHIEILILALVILPSKAVDDTGMLLSRWQKGLREFSREAFGSSHTTNRRRTLHIDQKDKAGRFYNSRRNECQITIHFFADVPKEICPIWILPAWIFMIAPPPSCKHCKIGAGGTWNISKTSVSTSWGRLCMQAPFYSSASLSIYSVTRFGRESVGL